MVYGINSVNLEITRDTVRSLCNIWAPYFGTVLYP